MNCGVGCGVGFQNTTTSRVQGCLDSGFQSQMLEWSPGNSSLFTQRTGTIQTPEPRMPHIAFNNLPFCLRRTIFVDEKVIKFPHPTQTVVVNFVVWTPVHMELTWNPKSISQTGTRKLSDSVYSLLTLGSVKLLWFQKLLIVSFNLTSHPNPPPRICIPLNKTVK